MLFPSSENLALAKELFTKIASALVLDFSMATDAL